MKDLRQLRALQALGTELAITDTVESVLDAWSALVGVFEARRAVFWRVVNDDIVMVRQHGYALGSLAGWHRVPLARRLPATDAVHTEAPVYLPSSEAMASRYPTANSRQALEADSQFLALPLRGHQGVRGVLTLEFDRDAVVDIDFQATLGLQFGQALYRAVLFDASVEDAVFERRILGALGHDLRSPLSAIRLNTQLIEQVPAEGRAAVIERIERNVARMDQIIVNMMELARNRERPPPSSAADLVPAMRERVEELRTNHPGRTVLLEAPEHLEARVDAGLLGQVLVNLARNGLVHGSPTGPVVVLLAEVGPEVVLQVRNEGGPVPMAVRERLYDAFQQGESGDGVGLGLYIVAALTGKMGGSVDCATADKGTSFTVRIPR